MNAIPVSSCMHQIISFCLKLNGFSCLLQWSGSSVYYLLGLWSRMVTSVRYLRSESPNQLNEYVPVIIEGFISSRFETLQVRLHFVVLIMLCILVLIFTGFVAFIFCSMKTWMDFQRTHLTMLNFFRISLISFLIYADFRFMFWHASTANLSKTLLSQKVLCYWIIDKTISFWSNNSIAAQYFLVLSYHCV